MAAPADRMSNLAYWTAITNLDFQNRCVLQWTMAAVSVTTEVNTTPSHTARLALAGQILAGQIAPLQVAIWTMTNTTIQTEVLTDRGTSAAVGNSVADNDIAFQAASMFTGLAISLPSSATSTI
jgi:hypothetical protein